MTYVFQAAKSEDVEPVFFLYKKRVHWMDKSGIHQWNDQDYLSVYPMAYFEKQQKLGNLYVLKDRECIIGAVVILQRDDRWLDRDDFSAYYIHNLVTDPAIKGTGKTILIEAEQLAIRHGKHFIRLDCAVDNAFLNEYYSSLGYELAGYCVDGSYKGNRREKTLAL